MINIIKLTVTLLIKCPLLEASMVRHSDPNLKARLAAATALSISAFKIQ